MRSSLNDLWSARLGIACGLLLAACPGEQGGSDSATGTATTGPATDATSTAGTSTTGATTPGTTGDATANTGAPTTGTTGGDPRTDCEAQFAELTRQIERDCMCLVEDGDFPDTQTCLADLDLPSAACPCPILAADPANDAWLACILAAERGYTACVTATPCDDYMAYADCAAAYYATSEGCGAPSKQSLGQTDIQCHEIDGFACTSGETIPIYYTCDAEADCADMSDEAATTCSFTCDSGELIDKDLVCDEKPDCMDMSDEAKALCLFTCGSGEDIPKPWVCDGESDCEDMSDEAMCLAPGPRPLTLRATGSWSAGTRPTRGPTAWRAGRAAAWPTR